MLRCGGCAYRYRKCRRTRLRRSRCTCTGRQVAPTGIVLVRYRCSRGKLAVRVTHPRSNAGLQVQQNISGWCIAGLTSVQAESVAATASLVAGCCETRVAHTDTVWHPRCSYLLGLFGGADGWSPWCAVTAHACYNCRVDPGWSP